MKKSFIYLAAALAFVSCSQNEITEDATTPVNSDVIGFTSSTNGTRAAANDQTVENLKDGFTVVGLDKDNQSLFAEPNGTALSSLYKFNAPNWGWEMATDDKKWPAATDSYPLTFIAAYPDNDAAKFGPWVTGGANYTADISVDEMAELEFNIDQLAAYSPVTSKPVSGMAPLNFKHILSKIQFQIISPVGYKVFVQNLIIKNVAKAGRTYNYNSVLASAYSEEPTYTAAQLVDFLHMTGGVSGSAELVGKGFDDLATEGVRIPSGDEFGGPDSGTKTWKLMPQKNVPVWDKANFSTKAATYPTSEGQTWAQFIDATPDLFAGSYIELLYRMEDADGKSIIGRKKDEEVNGSSKNWEMYVKVAFPLDIAKVNNNKGWEPNKQYTYQIKLGTPDASNGTLIDPNYKVDGGGDANVPVENPRPIKPGEDITNKDGYIGFDVIVDAWDDAGNTDIK